MRNIKNYIKHLNKKDQEYILSNQSMINDILSQDLDNYEIETLISTWKYVEEQKNKKQITMKISPYTLNCLKIKAQKEWLPYQTFIWSILYKYVTWQIK